MGRLHTRLAELLSTPARQAAGWVVLGVVGLVLGLGGALLILRDGEEDTNPVSIGSGPTTTATSTRSGVAPGQGSPSPSATASASPSPTGSPSPSPSPTATQTPARQQSGSTSGGSDTPPPPAPTATPPLVAAGGPYCDNSSSTAPPNSIIGLLTIGGADAPAGTIVSLAFDGVVGPSQATTAAGGYKVFWTAGGDACANRVGAVISVVANGQSFTSPFAVGSSGGTPLQRFDVAVP